MKVSMFIKAGFVSAFVMWIVAGIAHEVIFERFFADQTHESHKGPAAIFVAYCILALLMTYFYSIFPRRQKWLIDGVIFGAIIGVLWVFPHGLALAAAHSKSISHEILNGMWHILEQSIGGLVIAYIFNNQLRGTGVN